MELSVLFEATPLGFQILYNSLLVWQVVPLIGVLRSKETLMWLSLGLDRRGRRVVEESQIQLILQEVFDGLLASMPDLCRFHYNIKVQNYNTESIIIYAKR